LGRAIFVALPFFAAHVTRVPGTTRLQEGEEIVDWGSGYYTENPSGVDAGGRRRGGLDASAFGKGEKPA